MPSRTQIAQTMDELAKASTDGATEKQVWMLVALLEEQGLTKATASRLIDVLRS